MHLGTRCGNDHWVIDWRGSDRSAYLGEGDEVEHETKRDDRKRTYSSSSCIAFQTGGGDGGGGGGGGNGDGGGGGWFPSWLSVL